MSELFETTLLGPVSLKNRFVRAATWLGLATRDGACTDRLIDATVAVARGGAGLIITGFASVSRGAQVVPRQLDASDDGYLPGLTRLATAVHACDVPILLQLQHGGLFANPQLTGEKPAGPSAYHRGHMAGGGRMRIDEVEAVVQDFAAASQRAIVAGFDGVEIDAAHGLLPGQFLSGYFNRRADRYGGSLANRARFLVDIVVAIREAIGNERLLVVKLSASDYLLDGIRPDELVETAVALEGVGIDALEISGGTFYGFKVKNYEMTFVPVFRDDVYYECEARACRSRLSIPVMLDGGIRSIETARRLVEEGATDYVCLSRPLICEPDLVSQWQNGRTSDSQCRSDDRCMQPGVEGRGVYCVHSKGYRRAEGALRFFSGSTTAVNTERAVADCLERAFGNRNTHADFVIFHATPGHALNDVSAAIADLCPGATIVGDTCLGVIGREGPRDAPYSLAVMAIRGDHDAIAVATAESFAPADVQTTGRQLAHALCRDGRPLRLALLHTGTVPVGDRSARAIVDEMAEVLGPKIPILGSLTSEDGAARHGVWLGGKEHCNGLVAIGFADDCLEAITGIDTGPPLPDKPSGSQSHDALVEGAERLARDLAEQVGSRRPVAIFHADCPSRGQRLGARILKERLVASLQEPLCRGELVPWLGAYGQAQIASREDRAPIHNRSSALGVLVEREG